MVRLLKGLSLKQVSDATKGIGDTTGSTDGISPAYLHQLETGKVKNPSPHNLYKLSKVLDFPYERLLELAGYGYGQVGSASSSTDRTDKGAKHDHFAALSEALANAGLSAEEFEVVGGALREYELCVKTGIKPPPELASRAYREYRRIHEAGGGVAIAELLGVESTDEG